MSTAQNIHIFKSTTYRQTFETNAIITTPIIQALFIILNLAILDFLVHKVKDQKFLSVILYPLSINTLMSVKDTKTNDDLIEVISPLR